MVVTGIISRRNRDLSRILLTDTGLERNSSIISFSVIGENREICGACEKVTGFCETNSMPAKQLVRISLALEELMTLVAAKNAPKQVHFDIRMFSYMGTIGIRIRYDGIGLDPLSGREDSDEYMGIAMIRKMVRSVLYRRICGLNSLLVLI